MNCHCPPTLGRGLRPQPHTGADPGRHEKEDIPTRAAAHPPASARGPRLLAAREREYQDSPSTLRGMVTSK
jgi:hypothetical protein